MFQLKAEIPIAVLARIAVGSLDMFLALTMAGHANELAVDDVQVFHSHQITGALLKATKLAKTLHTVRNRLQGLKYSLSSLGNSFPGVCMSRV